MSDLRTALHEASPTDDLTPPDLADLRRGADRSRRRRRTAAAAAVVAIAAAGSVVATTLVSRPAGVDIAERPDDDRPSRAVTVPPDEQAAYDEWRDARARQTADVVDDAPAPQRRALDDGVVTEEEWLTAARAWQSCVREGGYDDFDLLAFDPPPGAAPSWSYETPSAQREYLEDRDEVITACRNEFFTSVEALWQEQETDHPRLWNTMQQWEDLTPDDVPDTGALTDIRLDDT